MSPDSKKSIIAVGILVSVWIALVLVDSWFDQYEARKFRKMTDTEHVKAASEAAKNSEWETARNHLYALKAVTVVKPTPDVQAKINACIASVSADSNDTHGVHFQIESCKERSDPNYRGYAGPENAGCASPSTQKYSIDDRKLVDCTFRPLSCETVLNAEGRRELCPTEAAVLGTWVDKKIEQANTLRNKEAAEKAKHDAEQAEAEQRQPDKWDLLPIEHKRLMSVFNAGYWGGGEYRRCSIEVSKNPIFLDCSLEGARREVDVRIDVVFDGSMDHATWDCKRRVTDIYCTPFKR